MAETLTRREEHDQMRDLINVARCLRCGKEDAYAGRGGWSSCFTVCDGCWDKSTLDSNKRPNDSEKGGAR